MIVVSDTTPINILAQIGLGDLLHTLFGSVIIPTAVSNELSHPRTPEVVRSFLSPLPDWIRIQAPRELLKAPMPEGEGERQAISLAVELHADLLLADDWRARQAAMAVGLTVTGTVGILGRAAKEGRIDLDDAIAQLRKTNFRVSDDVLALIRKLP